MGREIKRVPLDFDEPLNEPWRGYVMPDKFRSADCPDCKGGYSPQAQHFHDLWYGNAPFHPGMTGSEPLTRDTPEVRAQAEWHITDAPQFYGTGEFAIRREADRLAELFNGRWCCHLSQDDVDALIAADRLWGFTRTWSPETGWVKNDPVIAPTAVEVNRWELTGSGHDAINANEVIKARCKREGVPLLCATCGGEGCLEAWPGQREAADQWDGEEPPTGDGWQLWTTVIDGPISPVFADRDGLAAWMSDPARGDQWVPEPVAQAFITEGWAATGYGTATGLVSGVEHVGMKGETS